MANYYAQLDKQGRVHTVRALSDSPKSEDFVLLEGFRKGEEFDYLGKRYSSELGSFEEVEKTKPEPERSNRDILLNIERLLLDEEAKS